MSGLRVTIVDDAPYVAWDGRTHAANATFHRFAAALLDVVDDAGGPAVERLVLAAPVRPAASAPATLPVDPRIRVLPTEPFDGIAGYLRRAPLMTVRNLPRLRAAVSGADVVLLRLPASNGPLAALVARARDVPRVALVVGSVGDVVAAQPRPGPARLAARLVAAGYDAATRLAAVGARTVVLGARLGADGIVASLVEPGEVRDRAADPWPADSTELRLVYAGRLAAGKGLEALLDAVARLDAGADRGAGVGATAPSQPRRVCLALVGDGPASGALRERAASLGIADRVTFSGYVAERGPYLDALASADLFVSPSPAEGFPKTVLDAMAVGVPVVAVLAGRLAELAEPTTTPLGPPVVGVAAVDATALAATLDQLAGAPARARAVRAAGRAFVVDHTRPAEAGRLAEVLAAAARSRRRP